MIKSVILKLIIVTTIPGRYFFKTNVAVIILINMGQDKKVFQEEHSKMGKVFRKYHTIKLNTPNLTILKPHLIRSRP